MLNNVKIEEFLEIEKKYNLYENRVDGIDYWIYARFPFWHNVILKNKLNHGQADNQLAMSLGKKIETFARMLLRCIFKGDVSYGPTEVCFINHPRKTFVNQQYTCLYTEEVKQKFKNSITLEFPYNGSHLMPMSDKRVIFLDDLFFIRGIYRRLYKIFCKRKCEEFAREIREQLEKPFEELEQKYSMELKREQVINLMLDHVIYHKTSCKTIEKKLKKLNPKLVVEVVGYSIDCMMFNEICKKMGIETIELQHGIMTNHLAYNYNTKQPVRQLPDKILFFSDFWKQYINLPMKEENLITTGFPFFEKRKKEARKIEKYNDGKINILFISQWTIGEKLSKAAAGLAKLLEKEKYRIIYKLHPDEYANWREKYKWLTEEDIIVLDDNKILLYDCFATSRIQVGVYSTALYEGLGFGMATYIYRIEMSEQMEKLSNAGYVTYFSDAEELKQKIESNQEPSEMPQKTEQFWCENSLCNMTNVLNEILENC